MAAIWMYIDKFGGVVKIDDNHPLAVAQRVKDSLVTADTQPAQEPAASLPAEPPPVAQPDARAADQEAAVEAAFEAGALPPADRRDVPGQRARGRKR